MDFFLLDWSATGCYETTYERPDIVWFVQPYTDRNQWMVADIGPSNLNLAMSQLNTREFP